MDLHPMMKRLFGLLVLAGMLVMSHQAADAARRMALVIGIDDYAEITKLERAVGDARAVAGALRKLDFTVTEVINPTRRQLNKAIVTFSSRLQRGDITFVHFSGHGVEIQGDNYLLPSDAPQPGHGQSDFVRSEALSMQRLMRQIEQAGARTRLFVVDACRDNPFEKAGVRSIGSTRGLARVEAPSGTFIMYSAGYRQQALDRLGQSDQSPTSVYTRVLLKKLQEKGRAISQIARDIRADVEKLARSVGHDQRPAYYDELSASLVLNPGQPGDVDEVAAAVPKPQPNAPPPVAQAYAETKSVGSCEAYKVFAEAYKASFYGSLARAWIKKNCRKEVVKKQDAPASPPVEAPKPGPSLTERRQAAARACVALHGNKAVLSTFDAASNLSTCDCASGYVLQGTPALCRRQVAAISPQGETASSRRQADGACIRKYGFKARVVKFNAGSGSFECGCRTGFRIDAARSTCTNNPLAVAARPSDDNRNDSQVGDEGVTQKDRASSRRQADGACIRKYGFKARVTLFNASGRYACGCRSGYRINAARRTCERGKGAVVRENTPAPQPNAWAVRAEDERASSRRQADGACIRKYGFKARLARYSAGSGQFACGCRAGYTLDRARRSCRRG